MRKASKEPVLLSDWYSARDAAKKLSENSGRDIDISYPRTLAKYKLVTVLDLGTKSKLYLRSDIDRYIVGNRGKSHKKKVDAPEVVAAQ